MTRTTAIQGMPPTPHRAVLAIGPSDGPRSLPFRQRQIRRFTRPRQDRVFVAYGIPVPVCHRSYRQVSIELRLVKAWLWLKTQVFRLRNDPIARLEIRHEVAVLMLGMAIMGCAWLMMTLAVERMTSHQLRGNLAASCAVNPVPTYLWQPEWRVGP